MTDGQWYLLLWYWRIIVWLYSAVLNTAIVNDMISADASIILLLFIVMYSDWHYCDLVTMNYYANSNGSNGYYSIGQ